MSEPEVQSAMTPLPVAIDTRQSLHDAKQLMREKGVRHLPVKKNDVVCGILTHRDIHFTLAIEKKADHEVLVDIAYSPDPYTVSPETPVEAVAERFAQERIGCALIMKDDQLIGIFTAVDACRVLSDLLREQRQQ